MGIKAFSSSEGTISIKRLKLYFCAFLKQRRRIPNFKNILKSQITQKPRLFTSKFNSSIKNKKKNITNFNFPSILCFLFFKFFPHGQRNDKYFVILLIDRSFSRLNLLAKYLTNEKKKRKKNVTDTRYIFYQKFHWNYSRTRARSF